VALATSALFLAAVSHLYYY